MDLDYSTFFIKMENIYQTYFTAVKKIQDNYHAIMATRDVEDSLLSKQRRVEDENIKSLRRAQYGEYRESLHILRLYYMSDLAMINPDLYKKYLYDEFNLGSNPKYAGEFKEDLNV